MNVLLKRPSTALITAIMISMNANAGFKVVDGSAPLPQPQQHQTTVATPTADADVAQLQRELSRLSAELSRTQEDLAKAKTALAAHDKRLTQIGEKIDTISVKFAFGSTEFAPPKSVLSALVQSANMSSQIDIFGFTDSTGTQYTNNQVALKRATSAKVYLVSQGVPDSKINVASKAGTYIADNDTEAGRAQNRRVEILFN